VRSDERGIWRFHSWRIDELIASEFRVMDFTASGVANHSPTLRSSPTCTRRWPISSGS
jgi:hypothetical protein